MDMVVGVKRAVWPERATEQAHEPRQREIWTRWAVLGARALPSEEASAATG